MINAKAARVHAGCVGKCQADISSMHSPAHQCHSCWSQAIACTHVQVLPELGCAWSSQKFPQNDKYLLDRVSFTARAVRLGINVLLCDTDIVIFSDPYA